MLMAEQEPYALMVQPDEMCIRDRSKTGKSKTGKT